MGVKKSQLSQPWREQISRHRRQEDSIGRSGGVTHPASGRLWRWKRDGKWFDFLIEARTTTAGSYRIEKAEWDAITKEAHQTPPGCMPAMQIEIQDTKLIVIEQAVFEEIYNQLVSLRALAKREGLE